MSKKIVKTTILLFFMTILSRILGFTRETVLVSTYGASMVTDAYITSMNIPSVIFAVIGTALITTFIPLYYQVEREKSKEDALKFTNNVFNIVIVLSIILSLLGFLFAEEITKVFAINFTGEKLELSANLTKIMILGLVFIGLSNLMTCILQVNGNFYIPGIVSIPYNIIIILVIYISSKRNAYLLGIGTLISMLSQFIFQFPFAYKKGFRYKLYINLKDEYIKKMLFLIIPVFIGVGVNQINTIVDRSLASTLGDGIITILNSANKLNEFAIGLFISTISVVIYPMLSKLSLDGDHLYFSNTIKKCINIVSILIIPVSVGAIVLSIPVVRVVFERGSFDSSATIKTATSLSFYAIGMIGIGIKDILNRVFYSLKDTKTPMKNSTVSLIINIVLNLVLIKFMGYKGLAFATSISAICCVIFMFKSLGKKIGYFGQDIILKTIGKCGLASILMGVVVDFSYKNIFSFIGFGTINELISILLSVVIGIIIYGILIIILKVDEVYTIFKFINSKLKRKRIGELEG